MPDHRPLALDDPWTVNPADFPADGTATDKFMFLLNYAVLSPSILNTQPWRFKIANEELHVFTDPARRLPITDPHGRELRISCGGALLNLRVAIRAFGYGADIELTPDAEPPAPLAVFTLSRTEDAAETDRRLRDAIPRRHTDRGTLDLGAVSDDVLRDLSAAAAVEGAALHVINSAESKARAVDLVAEAEQTLVADSRYRQEIGEWIRQRVGEASSAADVSSRPMAGHVPAPRAQPDLATPSAVSVARMYPPSGETWSRRKGHLAAAPILTLISTEDDTPRSWIAAGQAMQRLLLVATNAGVSASFLNPAIEVPALRSKLAAVFGTRAVPQLLLRLGYGHPPAPEARRPVREVLV